MSIATQFPNVEGKNLEGREFTLPGDFEGVYNLILMPFQREQQRQVDTWLPAAKSLSQSYPGLRYYELPTMERKNWIMRSVIDRGMRSGIPDKSAREATITLYVDKQQVKSALDIPHEDTIYVFLVDSEGGITWRAEGVYTDEKGTSLNEALQEAFPLAQPSPETSAMEVATLAGGCFWCLEAVFDELKGVKEAESGYTGGSVPNPSYEQVCSGRTGHAEVVQITFDPSVISYGQLLDIFFTIHDPTTLNRQGADVGTQYRSAIFYHTPEQRQTAESVIRELSESGQWDDPIVTEVTPLKAYYPAEEYHQEYFRRNPKQMYCQIVIAPKVSKVHKSFDQLLKPSR